MHSLSARQKGLVTGITMILVSVVIYYTKGNFENKFQYVTYSIYAAGISWTLFEFSKLKDQPNKFGTYFSEGFKCFIVVALLMVMFTAVFLLMQPQLKEEMAVLYKAQLVKSGNYTLREIDEKISVAKKTFIPSLIMGAIFGYLAIGALLTTIVSGFLIQKNKMRPG